MSAVPKFVTCHCSSCTGGIEFERELFDPTNPSIIDCPHCGIEIRLYIPEAPITSPKAPDLLIPRRKRVRFSKGTRLTLTSEQCESSEVKELLVLLLGIEDDGLLTEEEVRRLNKWLTEKADSEISAIQYLLRTSDRILQNKTLTQAKAYEMQSAIERVLPKILRNAVIKKRQEASENSPASKAMLDLIRNLGGNPPLGITRADAYVLKEELWNRASEKQLNYIRDLGGDPSTALTREAASDLIQSLLRQVDPTQRQIMVLRFWNRTELMNSSKDEVTEWMSQFYEENPCRKLAWEIYKAENINDGSQCNASWVPIGIGETYLQKASNVIPSAIQET